MSPPDVNTSSSRDDAEPSGNLEPGNLEPSGVVEQSWSGEEFRQVVESAPDAMILVDDQGQIAMVNMRTEQLFGYDRHELLDQPVEILMPERFRDRHREHLIEYLPNAHVRAMGSGMELRGLDKNGGEFPVEISLSPVKTAHGIMVSGAIRDVTERKRAEEQLAHLSSIPEESPNPVIECDLNGNIIYLNPVAKTQIPDLATRGLAHPFFKGLESLIDDFQKLEMNSIVRNVDLGDAVYEQKISYVSRSNLVRIFASDITQQKRALEDSHRFATALQQSNLELERSNRELLDFAYVVSHDLRAPLVNIQGFSKELVLTCERLRMLFSEMEVPAGERRELIGLLEEDIPEAIDFITTSSAKMDLLLAGVLQLSRVGRAALTIRPLDMNQMLSEIVTSMKFAMDEAGVSLQVDNLPPCQGDHVQINQVFSNLLDNALKYLDPNRPGVVHVTGHETRDEVVYSIEDNGLGIAKEFQNGIYKIFHRLDPHHSTGEGLGLTIVRRVLDRHEGKIWLESEANKGCKFFVSLPKG